MNTNTIGHETSTPKQGQRYWKEAEQINGRLAMAGFFALVVNYAVSYTHLTLPTILRV